MPLRTEYSCRLREPEKFQKKSFRRIASGDVDLIIARPHGMKKTRAQAIRYPRELWNEKDAKRSCKKRQGKFEPVSKLCLSVGLINTSTDRGIDEYKGQNICLSVGLVNASIDHKPASGGGELRGIDEYKGQNIGQIPPFLLMKKKRKAKTKPRPSWSTEGRRPLPPDAQNVQDLSFNSDQFTCYGKPTGRGFRAYCRRK